MSVINKMLRDLDERHAPEASPGVPRGANNPACGTRSVAIDWAAGSGAGRRRVAWAALALGLALGLLGYWWVPSVVPIAAPVQAPVPLPVALIRAPDVAPEPPVLVPSVPIAPTVLTVPAASAVRPAAQSAVPVPYASELKMQSVLTHAPPAPAVLPATKAFPVPVAPPAVAAFAPVPEPRPNRRAAQEVLAQAQALWHDGAQAAAIDLLRGALLRLDASAAGTLTTETATLAAMARDYARMTLAQNQLDDALSMLTRLEPHLSGVADIWALRGSVAQRLGLHQQAAQAYGRALALRSDVPRWLLGAAVSLAALGQIGPAAELAEKARQAGALRPDVANYLRQLGVAIQAD